MPGWSSPQIPNRFVPLATIVLGVVAIAGCGLLQGMQDNQCGGDGLLEYDGELALPGEPCGPCDKDVLVCGDDGELTCEPGNTTCDAPRNFEAEGTDDYIELAWEHVDGAAEYRLIRDGDELASIDADDVSPGEQFHYQDHDADPGRHDAPTQFQFAPSGDRSEVTLSWSAPDGELSTQHHYELVAYYEQPHPHESAAVSVEAGRLPGDIDRYEYRWTVDEQEPVDWTSVGRPEDGDSYSFDHDVAPSQWPSPRIEALEATDGDAGWDVELTLVEPLAEAAATEFEIRAVSTTADDSTIDGEPATASWRPPVDSLSVQWLRRLSEDGDQDFELLDDTADITVGQSSEGLYAPEEPLEFVDQLPELPDEYTYRAVLQIEDYPVDDDEFREQLTAETEDTGFRAKPSVFTAASETGSSWRVDPHGDGQWEFDTDQDAVYAVTTGPGDDVYLGVASFGAGTTIQETIYSLDASDGSQNWDADWPGARIVDLQLCSDDTLIAAESDGTITRADSTTGAVDETTTVNNTTISSIAVDSDCNVFAADDDGFVRHISFSNDTPYWQQRITVGDDSTSMNHGQIGVTSDGLLALAATFSSDLVLQILDPDDDGDIISSYQVPDQDDDHHTGSFTDLVVDHNDRIYVAFYEYNWITNIEGQNIPADHGYIHVYEYSNFSATPDKLAHHYHPAADWGEDDFFPSARIHTVAVDPLGHLYYGTRSPGERVYQLADVDTKISAPNSWNSPRWVFDEYSTPNPNPDNQDPDRDGPEDCLTDPDSFSCVHVRDIAVTPGDYAAFPDAWDDVLERLGD